MFISAFKKSLKTRVQQMPGVRVTYQYKILADVILKFHAAIEAGCTIGCSKDKMTDNFFFF